LLFEILANVVKLFIFAPNAKEIAMQGSNGDNDGARVTNRPTTIATVNDRRVRCLQEEHRLGLFEFEMTGRIATFEGFEDVVQSPESLPHEASVGS